MSGPFQWIVAFLDRIDHRRAREIREAYGKRLRLLSWERDLDGLWRARLSGPGLDRTIERTGRTRLHAAEAASHAMDQILIMRYTLRPRMNRASNDFDCEADHGGLP